MDSASYEAINEAKANMDHIYNQPDPRAYFRELKKLDYAIPDTAKPIFRQLIDRVQDRQAGAVHMLDMGCSYGINAALLKYDLTMDELYAHWGRKVMAAATPEDVVAQDQRLFAELDASTDLHVVGLDAAENAVAYAETVGLLDEGLSLNLETAPLPAAAQGVLEPVDLILSTGCVGYVTEKSFDSLWPAVTQGRSPWIANFVLRMFPFDAIESLLDERGYVTERLDGRTFFQRQFASTEEQEHALARLRGREMEPTREELDGELRADFYLSRPLEEAAALPLDRLLAA